VLATCVWKDFADLFGNNIISA